MSIFEKRALPLDASPDRAYECRPNEITGKFTGAWLPTQARYVAHFCPAPTHIGDTRTHARTHFAKRAQSRPNLTFSLIVMATIALPSAQWTECCDEIVFRALVESVLAGYAMHLRVRGIMECLIQKEEALEAGDDEEEEEEEEEYDEEDEEGEEEGSEEGQEEEDDREGDEPPAKRRKKDDDEDKKKKEEGAAEEEEEVCSN